MSKLLFNGRDPNDNTWTPAQLEKIWAKIEEIAQDKYGLEYYPCDLVKVDAQEMIDLYTTHGLPEYPTHWKTGLHREQLQRQFYTGKQGLALEIVINTDPVQLYVMDNNTTTIQTMVLAHAGPGHGSFFTNNYLFKDNTDASFIRTYLRWARDYIHQCELKYGETEVEKIQDVCEILSHNSVFRYPRVSNLEEKLHNLKQEVLQHRDSNFVPKYLDSAPTLEDEFEEELKLAFKEGNRLDPQGEENLLYFFEKKSLVEPWKKELCRIYRTIAQYFYPQMLTKMMNEGWASFWHHTLMYDLYDQGCINEASIQEFLHCHSSVVGHIDRIKPQTPTELYTWPNRVWGNQLNPYTLGFYTFQALKRVCENPTEEDKKQFPDIAGSPWLETLKYIAYNFKDEEFIQQWLPNSVVRHLKLFCVSYDIDLCDTHGIVDSCNTDINYSELRSSLSNAYKYDNMVPRLDMTCYEPAESYLEMTYTPIYNRKLDKTNELQMYKHLCELWHGEIKIVEGDGDRGNTIDMYTRFFN